MQIHANECFVGLSSTGPSKTLLTGGGTAKSTRFECQIRKEETANKISCVTRNPILNKISFGSFAFHHGCSDECSVSSEEFATGDEGHDETEWESKCAKDDLLYYSKHFRMNTNK
jgi:hypothetical protein